MDNEFNNSIERQRRLQDDLNKKLDNQNRDLMNTINENIKRSKENNRKYYSQKLNEELDLMEKDIASGNTLSAFGHSMNVNMYRSLLTMDM